MRPPPALSPFPRLQALAEPPSRYRAPRERWGADHCDGGDGQHIPDLPGHGGTISSDQTATVTATFNSTSKTANISLVAAVVVSGLSCSPTSLGTSGKLHLHGDVVEGGGSRRSVGGAVEQRGRADSAGEFSVTVAREHDEDFHGHGRDDLERPDGDGDGHAEQQHRTAKSRWWRRRW